MPTPPEQEDKQPPEVKIITIQKNDRQPLDLGPKSEKLSHELETLIQQFYTSKGTPQATEQYFLANCNKAAQHFGHLLAQKTETTPSFLQRHPQSQYFDVRSEGKLVGAFAQFTYHSVGLIVLPSPDNQPAQYIAIDLTHDVGGYDARTLIIKASSEQAALEELKKQYGGKWDKNYRLNPQLLEQQQKEGKKITEISGYQFVDDGK